MRMAVQDQFRSVTCQQRSQSGGIGEPFAPADNTGCRRMVDHQHPKQMPFSGTGQEGFQLLQLDITDAAHRQMRCSRVCRADTDQGDAAPDTQTGKYAFKVCRGIVILIGLIRDHVIGPVGQSLLPDSLNIGIVVAGNDGNPGRGSQGFQPLAGFAKFGRQTQVGQISGDGNVIGVRMGKVILQSRKYAVAMLGSAMQSPFQIAE